MTTKNQKKTTPRASNPQPNPESHWFGTKPVTPDEKTENVIGVFSSVASRYDLMNDLMSLGVHRLWKDQFVQMVAPRPSDRILDVAGGTGDIAFRMYDKTNGKAEITVFDLNADMLAVGQDRAVDRGILSGLTWVCGNAEKLPFPDHSFDIYTIAFGLRNVTHIDTALAEAYRVLAPGGRFFCLEFSKVQEPLLDAAYQLWSRQVIPQIGKWVANDRDSYQYLVESIRAHPDQEALTRRLRAAGFDSARHENMLGGVVAVHVGEKY